MDKNRDYAQVLEERTGSGALEARYTYGDDLISQNRSGSSFFYLYDGQLSTRQLTDSSGAVTDTYTYDAFGVQLSRTGTTLNSYRYTGEQFDPNAGFYYLRARYYDQSAGRFLTVDPWKGNVFEPLSLHKYLYVHSDPVNNIDPSGEMLAAFLGDITASLRIYRDRMTAFFPIGMNALNMGKDVARRLNILPAKDLYRMAQNGMLDMFKKAGERYQIHHLIPEYMHKASAELQQIFRSANEIPGVQLTIKEHQRITDLFNMAMKRNEYTGLVLK